jgi:hypothetical protein
MHGGQTLSTAVLLAAVTVAVNRQSQPPTSDPEIVTDRPDITESAIVVPKGSLQFESGLTWTSDDGQAAVDLPENSVVVWRFGSN